MKRRTDAVSYELPHHRVTRSLSHFLDGVADVADVIAGARLRDACGQRLLCHGQQPSRLRLDIADRECRRGVGVQPLQPHAHIDADDVAVVEHALVRGNAVNDFLIDRRAERRGKIV